MAYNRSATLQAVCTVLAADLACPPGYLDRDEATVVPSQQLPGRRGFPFRVPNLTLVSTGRGAVASCSPERVEPVRAFLSGLDRDRVFSTPVIAALNALVARDGQELVGPELRYVCSAESFHPLPDPEGIEIRLLVGQEVSGLYPYPGFGLALEYRLDGPRPDVLAAAAWHQGEPVGVAGVSADCDLLWQVGIDVRPAFEKQGIGRALVSRATAAILEAGRVPYYTTAPAHLLSARIALDMGYWPCWIEAYVREAA